MQRRRSARIDLLLLSTVVFVALFSTGEVDCSHTPCTTQGACCYTAYREATRYVSTSRSSSYECNCGGWWGGCDTCYRTTYRSKSESYTQSYQQYSCCSGYSGNPCSDINECYSNNGGCQHNCYNTVGSYYCTCYTGWVLSSNGQTCTDVNECSSNNGGCDQNCHNTAGSYYCTCNSGWSESNNGRICTDINECSSNNGGCQHNCYNTAGSYYCTCNTGWALSSNDKTCTDGMNECSSNDGGCQHNCYNTVGSYYCTCNTGWVLSSNDKTCTDINECSSNNGGCQHNCYNTVGSYYCTCNTGWVLSSNGKTCTDINECYSNNGGCDQNCHNTVGSYYCSCNSGWTLSWNGKACADVNECASNHGCQHNCYNTAGSYYCTCNTGWVLSSNDQTCTVTIEATTTQDTYVVTDGGTAVVNCSATGGVAPANMTFHTPTGVLLTDTGSHGLGDRFYLGSTTLTQLNTSDSPLYQAWRTLTISGAAFEDSGTYTCSAANGTVEDTTGFDIFVEGIIEVSDAVIVKYNQTAEMECLALVFSTESSTVTWWWREATGNATQVVSGGGTVISTEVLGPDQLKSVLSIEVVDTTHDGVYVCVVNTGYNKLTADLLLLLEKERPHTPVNLTASDIGPTGLTLEWTAIFVEHKPIEEYIIAQKSPSASDHNITLENDKQGMPSLSIQYSISSDILPFTNYSFSVRACNHIGCSDESKPVLVTTPQDLPTEPLSFTLVETQSTSVSLQWKEPAMPNGVIVHYHIDYKPIASRSGIDYTASGVEARNCTGQILHSIPASVDTGPVLEWSLDRLLKATKYSFSIAATTEVGKGSTYSISVWTYDDVPEASPMEVTGESTTSSSITLSWEPPPANCQNGEITGYMIRFTNQPVLSPEEWSTQDVSGTAVDATIEGLEIFTEYFICIAARTSVDEYGPCSQPVNITTLTKSEIFNAVTIGSIGGGTAGLLVLLILVTACIAAAVKCQRNKLSQVQRKSCQNNELNDDMSNDAQGEKNIYENVQLNPQKEKSCQGAIYDEIKVKDIGMSHGFQDLPCHSNPSYGESLQLATTGTSKWMDNIY